MPSKYIYDFYFFDFSDPSLLVRAGQWGAINPVKYDGKTSRVKYAKKLKDLFGRKGKTERIFFQVCSSGPGYYLPVDIYNPTTEEKITVLGLLDSGASGLTLSNEIAEAIGVKWRLGEKIKAFKGENFTPLNIYRVKLKIGIPFFKKTWQTQADIINEKRSANLLGLSGFIDKLEIIFNPKFGVKYRLL
jgi:hypothetical protein